MFGHKCTFFSLPPTENLYRAKFDKKMLKPQDWFFHAPFEKSDYVNSTRFAIPGYPAIYLANSVVGCYRELGCKELEGFQAVKYQAATSLPFLNLDYNQPAIGLKTTNPSEYDMQLQAKGIIYPLLLCCNTQRMEDKPAPSEYIIPQFLLRWIKRSGGLLYGIKYPSTRFLTPPNEGTFYNIVIPPVVDCDRGHCEKLKKLLKLSQPCGITQHLVDAENYFAARHVTSNPINENVQKVEWEGAVSEYEKIELGKMEFYLRHNYVAEKPTF
jgi:hypothetical protein